jgi:uncharacterized membrane protein YhdT
MKKNREKIQDAIVDWAVLLAGLFLIGWQIYKYVGENLEPTFLEAAVLVVGVLFVWKPQTIVDAATRAVNRKTDDTGG